MRSGLLTHTHTQRHLCKVCAPCRISALGCVYAKARSPAHSGVLKQLGICKRKLSAAGAGTRSGWCFQSQNHVFIVQLAKYSAYFTVVLRLLLDMAVHTDAPMPNSEFPNMHDSLQSPLLTCWSDRQIHYIILTHLDYAPLYPT